MPIIGCALSIVPACKRKELDDWTRERPLPIMLHMITPFANWWLLCQNSLKGDVRDLRVMDPEKELPDTIPRAASKKQCVPAKNSVLDPVAKLEQNRTFLRCRHPLFREILRLDRDLQMPCKDLRVLEA